MLEQATGPTLLQNAESVNAMSEALKYRPGWQEVLINQDAQLIWQRLYQLIETQVSDETTRVMKTQELFLQLLAERRIDRYIEEELSDREIEDDLISQLL
ncbi:MAG: hypothetical protein AB1631_26450 [Acidobacteriota bacterium]